MRCGAVVCGLWALAIPVVVLSTRKYSPFVVRSLLIHGERSVYHCWLSWHARARRCKRMNVEIALLMVKVA